MELQKRLVDYVSDKDLCLGYIMDPYNSIRQFLNGQRI